MPERPDRPRLGRKGNKKVRTGCRTCKIRKVKCDEQRPFCRRCQQSGRVCDGYGPVPPRARRTVPGVQVDHTEDSSEESLDGRRELTPSTSGETALVLSPKFTIHPTDESEGTLQLFRKRTAPRLTGFMDAFFWNELVLQVGDVEPAVRHALDAVNSIYDYCETSVVFDKRRPLHKRLQHPSYARGLKAYNTAISELVRRPKSPIPGRESVHLVCCILFVCIEMLSSDRQAAISHFDQGLMLLSASGVGNEEQPGLVPKTDVVRETLVPIFRRLSLQAILFGREPPLIPIFALKSESLPSSTPFRTMDEANDALCVLLDHGLRLINEIVGLNQKTPGAKYDPERWKPMEENMKALREMALVELSIWNANFSPLAANTVATSATDPKAKIGCNVLRIQHLIAEIWISCILDTPETAFDAHMVSFAMVVHLASDIVYMEKAFGEPTQAPVFVFEMGVLAPLYFAATKCRQRRVRRAALTLLETWPRRENLWDPQEVHRAAKRMIEIEDKEALNPDAPDDIWPPEWKRIHKMDIEDEVDDDGKPITVAIFTRKPCGLRSEWEVIREIL